MNKNVRKKKVWNRRLTPACDRCSKMHVRCDGTIPGPCARCESSDVICVYTRRKRKKKGGTKKNFQREQTRQMNMTMSDSGFEVMNSRFPLPNISPPLIGITNPLSATIGDFPRLGSKMSKDYPTMHPLPQAQNRGNGSVSNGMSDLSLYSHLPNSVPFSFQVETQIFLRQNIPHIPTSYSRRNLPRNHRKSQENLRRRSLCKTLCRQFYSMPHHISLLNCRYAEEVVDGVFEHENAPAAHMAFFTALMVASTAFSDGINGIVGGVDSLVNEFRNNVEIARANKVRLTKDQKMSVLYSYMLMSYYESNTGDYAKAIQLCFEAQSFLPETRDLFFASHEENLKLQKHMYYVKDLFYAVIFNLRNKCKNAYQEGALLKEHHILEEEGELLVRKYSQAVLKNPPQTFGMITKSLISFLIQSCKVDLLLRHDVRDSNNCEQTKRFERWSNVLSKLFSVLKNLKQCNAREKYYLLYSLYSTYSMCCALESERVGSWQLRKQGIEYAKKAVQVLCENNFDTTFGCGMMMYLVFVFAKLEDFKRCSFLLKTLLGIAYKVPQSSYWYFYCQHEIMNNKEISDRDKRRMFSLSNREKEEYRKIMQQYSSKVFGNKKVAEKLDFFECDFDEMLSLDEYDFPELGLLEEEDKTKEEFSEERISRQMYSVSQRIWEKNSDMRFAKLQTY